MVAFLFGLHPLHTESVVWICEQKDVLSALFWLTLWAYTGYSRGPDAARTIVRLFFTVGLLAKPMKVTWDGDTESLYRDWRAAISGRA